MYRQRSSMGVALGLVLVLVVSACGARVNNEEPQAQSEAVGAQPREAEAPSDAPSYPVEPAAPGAATAGETGGQGQAGGSQAGAGTPAKPSAARPGAGSPRSGAAATPGGGKAAGSAGSPAAPSKPSAYPDAVTITGPHSQGVTDKVIKVGLAVPLSGALGFVGNQIINGVRAYLQAVNDSGGVRGRKYQMIVLDTQFDPSLEALAARRLVEQDKVFVLILTFGDSAAPYVTSKGIPDIAFGVTPPTFSSKYPTTYPIGWSTVEMLLAEAYQMTQVLKVPIKSTALLYATQNTPIAKWTKQIEAAWTKWGVAVKSIDPFDFSDGDCTRLVLKMQDLKIDYWALAQTPAWPICQQAMARQNYTPPLGRGGPYTPDFNVVGQAGKAAHDVWGMSDGVMINFKDGGHSPVASGEPYPWHPSGRAPEIGRYLASVKKYSPAGDDIENIWTQTFWTGAKLLDEAVRRQTDAITWQGVNKWIQSQRNFVSGLLPPFSLVPTCKTGAPAFMFQWKWDGTKLVQTDWRPYGGRIEIPMEAKNYVTPGGGECYLTKMADQTL